MATQYTDILKLALPVQGELTGTWGTTINDEITTMVEQAIAGLVTIDVWAADSHTLSIVEGAVSESRAAILRLTDTTVDLSGAGTLITPAQSKVYIVENNTGQVITIKTSAGTGVAIPNTKTGLVFCDGVNVEDGISYLPYTNATSGLTATTVQTAIDEVDGDLDALTASLGTASTYDVGTAVGELPTNTDTDAKYLPFTGGVITGDTSITGAFIAEGNFNVCSDGAIDENPIFNRAEDYKGGQAISQKRSRGTLLAPTALIDEDIVAGFTSQPHDGTEYLFTAAVRSKVDGTPTTGFVPQKVVIETSTGATGEGELLERVVVKPDGKVGIGTATPATELDLVGDLTVSGAINLAGNVLINPLDYGLGTTLNPTLVDFAADNPSGLYTAIETDVLNFPATNKAGFQLMIVCTNAAAIIGGAQITSYYVQRIADLGANPAPRHRSWNVSMLDGVTSITEIYNSGNSVNPLDYGLGVGLSADTSDPSGFSNGFAVTGFGTDFSNPWADGERAATLTNRGIGAGMQIAVGRASGNMYFQYGTTLAGTWNEIYHSGNSVNPLDYGLGGYGPTIGNANANLKVGFYAGNGGTSTNYPGGMEYWNFLSMARTSNNANHSRIYIGQQNSVNKAYISSSIDAGTSFQDSELYHSGNSVNPLDFGLGDGTAPIITDFTAVIAAGHYRCTLSTVIGGPETLNYAASVLVENAVDGGGQTFLVKRQTATLTNLKMWLGSRTGNSGAITWVEIYHSGNTNFDVFTSSVVGDVIAIGIGATTTTAIVHLPLVANTAPTSLTIPAFTFKLSRMTDSVVVETGITAGDISLNALSSRRVAKLVISNCTGLVAGTAYELRTENTTSSITVVF